MFVKENNKNLKYLFHYTRKENLEKILQDKEIKPFNDKYTFFATSYEDSCKLFKKLMMNEINYIDDELTLQKREIQNPNDYAILKIKIKNDNNFYRFIYETQEFNPYNYSVLHKGNLKLDKFEILEINDNYEESVINKRHFTDYCWGIKKLAITASISALFLFGNLNTVGATSWKDSGDYTTSWYNSANSSFNINNSRDLAGFVHLVNNGDDTFENKTINIVADIEATQYTWKEISSNFKGTIEGLHKIVIALESDDEFISSERTSNIAEITVIKNYVINTDISSNATIQPSGRILVKESEDKDIKITANTGYEITNVNIDGINQTINNKSEFSYTFADVTKSHKITTKTEKVYTHIKNIQNNILNTSNKTQIINYSETNPYNSSYTEVIDDITYKYEYKDCSIEDSVYTWNYEASIVEQKTIIEEEHKDENAETIKKDKTPKTGRNLNIVLYGIIIMLITCLPIIAYKKK